VSAARDKHCSQQSRSGVREAACTVMKFDLKKGSLYRNNCASKVKADMKRFSVLNSDFFYLWPCFPVGLLFLQNLVARFSSYIIFRGLGIGSLHLRASKFVGFCQ
jgi:hypothetical protein